MTSKGRHLTDNQRKIIESELDQRSNFQQIAQLLGKDPTTIAKEIKRNRTLQPSAVKNQCRRKSDCGKVDLCSKPSKCGKLCRSCSQCNDICPDFSPLNCSKLSKAPTVCNGCLSKGNCRKNKYFYRAGKAQLAYATGLSQSRAGINLTWEQLAQLDELLSPLVRQGQPLAHLYNAHKEEIPRSLRSLYHYIDLGLFTARNLDLVRKVRFRPRKTKKPLKDQSHRAGRSYLDLKAYLEDNPNQSPVEMDLVLGKREAGPCLLTLFFRKSRLMLIRLLPDKTKGAVKEALDQLEEALGLEKFQRLFPVIPTDNGPEFRDPEALERSPSGESRSKVFYCDPYASWQKGALERNHEYIRQVLPKGRAFDQLTPEQVCLLANHINSVIRPSLGNLSPFQVALSQWDESLLEKLGLKLIPADQVCLVPQLLK